MAQIFANAEVMGRLRSAPGDGATEPPFGDLLGSLLGGAIDENTLTNLFSPVLGRLINDALGTFWLTVMTPLIIGFVVLGALLTVIMTLLIVLIAKTSKVQKQQNSLMLASPNATPERGSRAIPRRTDE